ncbi:hypothetical protein [Haploplasma axanthum]|uniref:Uncharacterized protein n=1 Tax=Haploplasma axanthum TaxID=29552 RepID=A0A449BB92_HAPAX|nr:hypothetical protein [Haploplasma axanthum]VEU79615.1 Uncharacterised protein [Haploplasma axanthum]
MRKILLIIQMIIVLFIFTSKENKDYDLVQSDSIVLNSVNGYDDYDTVTKCTVTFDLNGGELNGSKYMEPRVYERYEVLPYITAPTKKVNINGGVMNLLFQGWKKDSDGKIWNYDEIIVNDEHFIAQYAFSRSIIIKTIDDYLLAKYNGITTYSKEMKNINDITNGIPVEVQGRITYADMEITNGDLAKAKENSGIKSSYGGCGPLSMIGHLDFLGRYKGYKRILSNARDNVIATDTPQEFNERVDLATRVFSNTKTYEIGIGDKSTFCEPTDYIKGLKMTLKSYGYEDSFKISHYNLLNKNATKINAIYESINKGMPVVVWTSLMTDSYSWLKDITNYSSHYFGIYGYEKWITIDDNGEKHEDIMFLTRPNFGYSQNKYTYLDMEALIDGSLWGVIVTEEVENFKSINPHFYGFPGQYFFDSRETKHSFIEQNDLKITRLRSGYVQSYDSNNKPQEKYLVLSSNKKNAGKAFIDYEFSNVKITSMDISLSMWGSSENLHDNNSRMYIEVFDGKVWRKHYNFVMYDILRGKDNSKKYYFSFGSISKLRIILEHDDPNGTRNLGRIVIGDIKFGYK